jgi:CRP/FNR family cyclic AMP-dependent transcriptional regulator
VEVDRLTELDYFHGMGVAEIEVISGAMREDAWWDGTVVVQQGEQKGGVYFVLEGGIRVERRQDNGEIVTVGRLGPGAVFGILGVLDGVPRAATCVAEGTLRCAFMGRKDFLDLMNGLTSLALRFQVAVLRCLARDIRSTNARLTELAALPSCSVNLEDLEEVFGD